MFVVNKGRRQRGKGKDDRGEEDYVSRFNDFAASGSSHVNLTHTHVGDKGVSFIVSHSHMHLVTTLVLQWCDIWADGAIALAKALSNEHCCLKRLDLGHNNIGTTGVFHLAGGLKFNSSLQFLFLNDNDIDDEGASYILDNMNNSLREISLIGNPIKDSSLIAKIQAGLCRDPYGQKKMLEEYPKPIINKADKVIKEELEMEKKKNSSLNAQLNERSAQINRVTSQYEHKLLLERQKNVKLVKEREDACVALQSASQQEEIRLKAQIQVSAETNQNLIEEKQEITLQLRVLQGRCVKLREEKEELVGKVGKMEVENEQMRTRYLRLEERLSRYNEDLMLNKSSEEFASVDGELDDATKDIQALEIKRMKKRYDDVIDSKRCKICFEQSINMLLLPCAHLILCQTCSQKVANCPLCSKVIDTRVRVYEG